jgi:ribosomal protein L11 methyltransferase
LGTAGVIEQEVDILAFFERAEQANAAAQRFERILLGDTQHCTASPPFQVESCDPILIGGRFFIAPSSSNAQVSAGRIRLAVDAQSAFGSGRHESTQLMMQALERCMQSGMTVFDVGCGSGILAMAARLLGAAHIFACDIDSNAISVARRVDGIALFAGSADALQTGAADLVLANISARVVDALAPDLHRVAKPNGRIIVAGFLNQQPPRRVHPESTLELNEWQCWICQRDASLAAEQTAAAPHPLRWW